MDPESGSDEQLLPAGKKDENDDVHESNRWRPTVHLILYTITVAMALVVGYSLGSAKIVGESGRVDDECTRHVSHYSPIMKDVPITYREQRFNGSLLKENIFRQDASPEVDAAWESLGINCMRETR